MPSLRFRTAVSLLTAGLTIAACAPEPVAVEASTSAAVTLADYERAEQFLAVNTSKLMRNNILAQYWQDDDRLIYRRSTLQGSEYMIVDVVSGEKSVLFDTKAVAAVLADLGDEEIDVDDLSLSALKLGATGEELRFNFDDDQFLLNLSSGEVVRLDNFSGDEYLSPDGSKAAYVDSHNLWLRDTVSNELVQLTFDGEENYGYATNNAGWIRDDGPVLLWSPDSSKIATFRHDGRNVGEMYLYSTEVGHLELDAWKYPLPGDEHIFMIERLVIHLGGQIGFRLEHRTVKYTT
ncbi:MAG TPA: hypothetical protein EYG63_04630 [Gammaproteobacteria bacterium]|nr:hypothetical protein [Gammaproteobacteria bacterium]